MSVYMNYPPTWRPLDFAMHYGIGVNRLNIARGENSRKSRSKPFLSAHNSGCLLRKNQYILIQLINLEII